MSLWNVCEPVFSLLAPPNTYSVFSTAAHAWPNLLEVKKSQEFNNQTLDLGVGGDPSTCRSCQENFKGVTVGSSI